MKISYIGPATDIEGKVLEDFVYVELKTIHQVEEYIDTLEKLLKEKGVIILNELSCRREIEED